MAPHHPTGPAQRTIARSSNRALRSQEPSTLSRRAHTPCPDSSDPPALSSRCITNTVSDAFIRATGRSSAQYSGDAAPSPQVFCVDMAPMPEIRSHTTNRQAVLCPTPLPQATDKMRSLSARSWRCAWPCGNVPDDDACSRNWPGNPMGNHVFAPVRWA